MGGLSGQVQELFTLVQSLLVTWGMKVLGAVAVLIVGRMLAGSSRKGVGGLMERAETDATLQKFLSSLAYYLVLVVAVVAALGMVEPAASVGNPLPKMWVHPAWHHRATLSEMWACNLTQRLLLRQKRQAERPATTVQPLSHAATTSYERHQR